MRSISTGEDAQGEARVKVHAEGRDYHGRAVSTDVLEASALAYLEVVNRFERRRVSGAERGGLQVNRMMMPLHATIIDKIWDAHCVRAESDAPRPSSTIDLHLVHEVTTPQAFDELRSRGLTVRRPERTLATLDHSTPTLPPNPDGSLPYDSEATANQVATMERNCEQFGITLHGFGSGQRGVVHVMGPELGATQPGITIVCGDSHTATHGAFGALAFGIGTTEVGHVLATQCLLQRRPKTLAVTVNGTLRPEATAKDLILHIIGVLGMDGGTGHVIEYRGEAIRALSMEGRMTLCNMSIEAGARAGLVAPDETTSPICAAA